jgi:hypothetical protein
MEPIDWSDRTPAETSRVLMDIAERVTVDGLSTRDFLLGLAAAMADAEKVAANYGVTVPSRPTWGFLLTWFEAGSNLVIDP